MVPVPMRWCPPRWLIVILIGVAAAGCTQTQAFKAKGDFERPEGTVRVLLMPPDVELYELTAAGLEEPKADWTASAERNVRAALKERLAARGAELVDYQSPDSGITLIEPEHVQLVKLHEAVGNTIIVHTQVQQRALPTKRGPLDWTLGQNAAMLREAYGADYALFVFFRESFASAGRQAVVALGVVASLFTGVPGPSAGVQVGFASLVHLRSGDVLWFNVLSSETGDLRDPAQAAGATSLLLSELPL